VTKFRELQGNQMTITVSNNIQNSEFNCATTIIRISFNNILKLKRLKWGYSIITSSSTEIKSKCLWWAAHVDCKGKQEMHAEHLQLLKHGYLKHHSKKSCNKSVCVYRKTARSTKSCMRQKTIIDLRLAILMRQPMQIMKWTVHNTGK